jgi:hypothetical protein
MPQTVLVGDICVSQVIIYVAASQQTAVLNRYWRADSIVAPGVVTDADLALQLDGRWAARYKAAIFNAARFNGTRVRILYRPPAFPNFSWQVFNGAAGLGTAGVIALPEQVSGLITLLTDTIGRHGEGRQYVPFPSATNNSGDGIPDAGYEVVLNALANTLVSPLNVIGGTGGNLLFNPVIFPRAAIALYRVLTASRVVPAWATQKRRGSYGRFNTPPF